MSMTDPIADFLARIRNGILARHADVLAPSSKLKQRICELLKDEGFIAGYDVRDDDAGHRRDRRPPALGRPAHATRSPACAARSRPGQRMYVRHGTIPKVRSGLGIAILSTSQGLMTDRAARKAGPRRRAPLRGLVRS